MNAVMPLEDYTSACDRIREKTGTTEAIKSGELKDKIDSVYLSGINKGFVDGTFWDLFQNYGKRKSYADAFYETAFEYIRPKYKVIPMSGPTDCARTFYNNDNLKKLEKEFFDFSLIPLGTYSGTGFYWTFGSCGALEEIEDIGLENQKYWQSTFLWCGNLRKIARIRFRGDEHFDQTFHYCSSLEDVNFEGAIGTDGLDLSYSPNLNKKSLESLLNCLKDFCQETVLTEGYTFGRNATETVCQGELVEGEKYKWSFYCNQYPGWLVDSETDTPISEENILFSVAGKVNIDGTEYVGFTAVSPAWASWSGTYTYTVFSDNGSIKVRRNNIEAGDFIKLSAYTFSEKHALTLGEANLQKLTEEEKNTAKEKGWTIK